MNFFFWVWLTQHFGGGRLIQALTNRISDLEDLSLRLQNVSTERHEVDWLRQHMGPKDLIRHFALAKNVNLPDRYGRGGFRVDGWPGFENRGL